MLVPGGMSIIGASFSDEQRGTAFGTWVAFTQHRPQPLPVPLFMRHYNGLLPNRLSLASE